MALRLLLVGGFWAQVMSTTVFPGTTVMVTPSSEEPASLVPVTSEVLNLNSAISIGPMTKDPKEIVNTWRQTPVPPSSTPVASSEVFPLGASVDASTSPPVPEPTPYQEISTNKSLLSGIPTVTIDPAVAETVGSLEYPTLTDRTMTFNSLEITNGTSESSVTMATSSSETSGPPVTIATNTKISSPLVTMATTSLEPSHETHGGPATTAVSSLETSIVVITSPISSIKISMESIPKTSINASTRSPESKGMLLVPVLVALLVVMVLVSLLLLWRRRQKRRTGVLTLSRGGKHNGVVDAWAGIARVPDEEAMTAVAAESGGDKGSRVPETEASGQRPILTTFLSRRKSHLGSLELEELKSGSGPSLKGEEEPLVGSDDEAVEAPTSDGAAPQCL